jgi:serine/threonine-protein kinase
LPPAPRTHRSFAPQKQELQRGDALGDFELSDLIDEGYNFRTYLSRHPALGMEVRLRVVKPEAISDEAAFRQFLLDMERVSYIHHPSLIRVFSVGTEGRWTFVVEENFRSISAQKLLEEHGPLNELQVLAIARQVVQVFPEFHEKGISHRNITPDHLLVNSSGLVKLQGLGMASLCGPDRTHPQRGTPLYVAPEIIQKGSVVDLRADIYSLGASMYHLVTGTPPFSGESPEEIFEKHMCNALVDPRRRRNEISPGMAGLLLHMMEKRPAARHQTAAELLEEIQSILTRTGSGDGRTTQLTSKLLAPFRRNRAK